MSLGPKEATVKLMIGGVLSADFYAKYQRAVIQAMDRTADWLQALQAEIPVASRELKQSLQVETDLYGQEKTIKFQITRPYAQYVLEFGRKRGKRPPWHEIRQWAQLKGVPLRQARAWWWNHGREGKHYRGPKGSLFHWWSEHLLQLRYILERELKTALTAAGFSLHDVKVEYS
jgi:hypothetical protein